MKFIGYDFEVFAHDWLVVFKDYDTKEKFKFHNNPVELRNFIQEEPVYYGFNTKHYDRFIMSAVCSGAEPEEVKLLNDYIIAGNQGWDYPEMRNWRFYYNNMDVMDDMQVGQSLKSIEGHLGMDIEETEVDFNLDRPLTDEEIERTFHYCGCDVDATEKILDLRMPYIKNKIYIGKLAGLTPEKAVGMTNAKLTAALLKAEKKEHNDERKYVYPEKLKKEYIPQEVFDFFDRMKDPNIPDDEVFKGTLNIMVGDCPVTLGFGGIHGARPNYVWEEQKE